MKDLIFHNMRYLRNNGIRSPARSPARSPKRSPKRSSAKRMKNRKLILVKDPITNTVYEKRSSSSSFRRKKSSSSSRKRRNKFGRKNW